VAALSRLGADSGEHEQVLALDFHSITEQAKYEMAESHPHLHQRPGEAGQRNPAGSSRRKTH
jgi:hypothetical protein